MNPPPADAAGIPGSRRLRVSDPQASAGHYPPYARTARPSLNVRPHHTTWSSIVFAAASGPDGSLSRPSPSNDAPALWNDTVSRTVVA